MLVRREGETLDALLKRLDKAIAQFYDDGKAIDEIWRLTRYPRQDDMAGRLPSTC